LPPKKIIFNWSSLGGYLDVYVVVIRTRLEVVANLQILLDATDEIEGRANKPANISKEEKPFVYRGLFSWINERR
jgi:hypothetical protein